MRAHVMTMAALAALLATPAPAATDAAPVTTKVAGVDVIGDGDACVWGRNVDGWTAVDRRHVILETVGDERYLVRFSGAGLANPKFEFRIGLKSRTARVCGKAGDDLLIGGERAMILEMWRMPPEEKRAAAD